MADGDPTVSLLDQAAANPGGGIMSLLGQLASGGAIQGTPGQLLSQDQIQNQAMPALLAFGQRMAAAGAPTLGPPVSMASALSNAMGAGYSAARQGAMLPIIAQQAQQEQEAQQIALQSRAFDLTRQKALLDLQLPMFQRLKAQMDAIAGGGTGAAPGDASAPPAGGSTAADLVQLPDFQALPDASRVPAAMVAANVGVAPAVAAQWARLLMGESKGLQIDPKTGETVTSAKGALGVGQVMPATFADMANKYGIDGKPTDLIPNLTASLRYFNEGVIGGGNLHDAVIRYNAGPDALAAYKAKGTLPAETGDLLLRTKAPPPPGADSMVVSPDRTAVAPGYNAPPSGPAIVGDSLASSGGLGGSGTVGASPSAVAAGIQSDADRGLYRGRPVVLSSGASNAPTDLASVDRQLRALNAGGASNVTLLGVGPTIEGRAPGTNAQLAALAAKYGASFQPLPDDQMSADGIHPTGAGYATLRRQTLPSPAPDLVAGPGAPNVGPAAPPPPGVAGDVAAIMRGMRGGADTGTQVADASGRTVPSAPPAPGSTPTPTGNMVKDPLSGMSVPQSVVQSATLAMLGHANDPDGGIGAYQQVIQAWQQHWVTTPTTRQVAPGVQEETGGRRSEAPLGETTTTILSDDDARKAGVPPDKIATSVVSVTKRPDGSVVSYNYSPREGQWEPVPGQPGMVRNPVTGETKNAALGPTYADAPTPAERAKFAPDALPNQDYQVERYSTGPLQGQIVPGSFKESTSPRAANIPFQRAMDIQNGLMRQPAMEQWQLAQNRYDTIMEGLNEHTRAGDDAALQAFAKMFDPSAVVHEGRLSAMANLDGVQQQFQEWLGKYSGTSGLPDDVRQQLGNMATIEATARDRAALLQIRQARAFATANGVPNADATIGPGFEATALSADKAGPAANMKGVTFGSPYVFNPSSGNFERGPPSGAAPGPPATAASPGAGAPAPKDRFTDAQVGGLSLEGLNNAIADMKANRGNYTDADVQRIIAEATKRAKAAAQR